MIAAVRVCGKVKLECSELVECVKFQERLDTVRVCCETKLESKLTNCAKFQELLNNTMVMQCYSFFLHCSVSALGE